MTRTGDNPNYVDVICDFCHKVIARDSYHSIWQSACSTECFSLLSDTAMLANFRESSDLTLDGTCIEFTRGREWIGIRLLLNPPAESAP